MHISDKYNVRFNVKVGAYKDNKLIDQRQSHNVMTNTGRNWLSRLVGASDYSTTPPLAHTTDKVAYVGLGCGGALQTDPLLPKSQTELVTVEALEDPIPFSVASNVSTYLKKVNDQNANSSVYFPGSFRSRFIIDVAETEISYTGSTTSVSNVNVGTSVPISEAGLYLSSAQPTWDGGSLGADPSGPNSLVCYNIFDPIFVTPNVVLRVEWELRF